MRKKGTKKRALPFILPAVRGSKLLEVNIFPEAAMSKFVTPATPPANALPEMQTR